MAIEYLRAKRTFDSFTENFGKVNFSVPRFSQNLMTTAVQKRVVEAVTSDVLFGKHFVS